MSIHRRHHALAIALVLALAGNAHAHGEGDHDHDHDQGKGEGHAHGAHEHGVAHADIAIDANGATIELTVTGADLVGFEGEAADGEARAKLDAGRKILVDGAELFAFAPAGGCKAAGPGELAAAAGDKGKHDHDHGHDHDHDHDHDHGHDHADPAKAGDADAAASPADWRVTYRYDCEDGTALTGLSTAVFKAIPSLAEVRVQLVAPAAQAGATLTPQAPELRYAGD